MTTYRAAVIGLGRMGSTFDDEMSEGGSIFLPYCHAPSYCASSSYGTGGRSRPARRTTRHFRRPLGAGARPSLRRLPPNAGARKPRLGQRLHHRPHSLADRRGLRPRWRQGRMGRKADCPDVWPKPTLWSRPAANTARLWPSTAPAAGTRSSVRLAVLSTKAS